MREVELAMKRRAGASEQSMLVAQNNLAASYHEIGRFEESTRLRQDVYSVRLKLLGISHEETVSAAYNYALSLLSLERDEEAKSLLRKMVPVARRVLGEDHLVTLGMRTIYAQSLYSDPGATLDDLREGVRKLEDGSGPRGVCLAVHTRSQWGLRGPCESREAPARSRQANFISEARRRDAATAV